MNPAAAHASHVGLKREHNEDSILARPDLGLWVVADGMGGHSAGEVASAIVVRTIESALEGGEQLDDAVGRAHQAILDAALRGEGASGMGSTVVALQLQGSHYRLAWVGDSRAYLWNGRQLRQLTRDHSFVQRMLESGVLTQAEAEAHPDRGNLAQALGVAEDGLVVDVLDGALCRDETLLLCSDGLSGEVADEVIERAFRITTDEQQLVDLLVEAALASGGADNVSVIVVKAPADAPVRKSRGATVRIDTRRLNQLGAANQRFRRLRPLVVGMGVGLVAAAVFIAWMSPARKAEPPVGGGGGPSVVTPLPAPQVSPLSTPNPSALPEPEREMEQQMDFGEQGTRLQTSDGDTAANGVPDRFDDD